MSPRRFGLDGDHAQIPFRGTSLLLGRSPDCDVVVPDPLVSRHHALLRIVPEGVELVQLGRAPLEVNGAPAGPVSALRPGDWLSLGGRRFRLTELDAAEAPSELVWALTRDGTVQHPLRRNPFSVGGDVRDDLCLHAWPAHALTFTRVQHGLALEAHVAGVSVDHPLEVGEVVTVRPGARVSWGDDTLLVLALAHDLQQVTAPVLAPTLPLRAALRFLAKGGELTLGFAQGDCTAWLADRRCDLVAALLRPPPPYVHGEAVPDEALLPRVWPGAFLGRTELNTLVFRARKDLVKANLDGGALIERRAGSVRFVLAPQATVRVETG
ncbi:MAG: FHA domain-containing protein [Polyangiales bacterium]